MTTATTTNENNDFNFNEMLDELKAKMQNPEMPTVRKKMVAFIIGAATGTGTYMLGVKIAYYLATAVLPISVLVAQFLWLFQLFFVGYATVYFGAKAAEMYMDGTLTSILEKPFAKVKNLFNKGE